MKYRRQPQLESGFGPHSTASGVLRGHDLAGRRFLVTGAAPGPGLETIRALAGAGAHVIATSRDPARRLAELAGLARVQVLPLELEDLDSIRRLARRLLDQGRLLDGLMASASMASQPLRHTARGWEQHLAVNHLGHFALINRLWPLMRRGGRIVVAASAAHRQSPMHWDDVDFHHGYTPAQAQAQAQTANLLMASRLDALARLRGVRAFAANTGAAIAAATGQDSPPKTAGEAAATQVWAATDPSLQRACGVYCEDCNLAEIASEGGRGAHPHALDPQQAERLWRLSAERTGCDAFAEGNARAA